MAKKDKEDGSEKVADLDINQLGKMLIREMNKGDDKIAWNLASDEDNPTDVKEFISFGSLLLDYITTNRPGGGAPVGKITEIIGEEASGKSLVIAHLIAECQKRGGLAVLMDTENAFNPLFATSVGVNVKALVYSQPRTCEEVGETIERTITLARTKAPNALVLIAWDSIANTPTKAEVEGSYETKMDLQLEKSKVLSKMMRKLVDVIGKQRICVVFTNQLKTKIGVMYGDPMTTPGGKAVPYAASLRIRLNRGAQLQEGKKNEEGADDSDSKEAKGKAPVYGIHTSAKIVKNRLGPPLRKCEFDITFASGIDDEQSWLAYLHSRGRVERADGWYYYTSFPSGKMRSVPDKKDPKKMIEYDRGLQFREKEWKEALATKPGFREHVRKELDELLVVKYGERPADFEADEESLLDVEGAIGALT